MLEGLRRRPPRKEEERSILSSAGRQVVLVDVLPLAAGDEVRGVDEVGGLLMGDLPKRRWDTVMPPDLES